MTQSLLDDPEAVQRLMDRALAAGASVLQEGRTEAVSQRGRDIKLAADARSQAAIVAALRSQSDLPILAEEGGWVAGGAATDEAPYWVVDPLDGSFNYARGLPLYGICIALCSGRTPRLGAIADVPRGEVYFGGPAVGLYRNGEPIAPAPPRRDIFATGFPVANDHGAGATEALRSALGEWKKIRMIGSAGLSLAWVAAGVMDGYAEEGIRWWDVAAGLALVAGAGGTYTAEGLSAGSALDRPLTIRAWRSADMRRQNEDD